MTQFKDIDSLPDDARYREGVRGEVDIFDEKVGVFLRVDEGDTIEEYGNGYTVVKAEDNEVPSPLAQENFPELGHDDVKTAVTVVDPEGNAKSGATNDSDSDEKEGNTAVTSEDATASKKKK